MMVSSTFSTWSRGGEARRKQAPKRCPCFIVVTTRAVNLHRVAQPVGLKFPPYLLPLATGSGCSLAVFAHRVGLVGL